MARLHETRIRELLASVEGWEYSGKEIRKTFRLKDFSRSMGFVTAVALIAEKANHHPDIDIRWNTVTCVLSTHDEGGVTEKDISLARSINDLQMSGGQ